MVEFYRWIDMYNSPSFKKNRKLFPSSFAVKYVGLRIWDEVMWYECFDVLTFLQYDLHNSIDFHSLCMRVCVHTPDIEIYMHLHIINYYYLIICMTVVCKTLVMAQNPIVPAAATPHKENMHTCIILKRIIRIMFQNIYTVYIIHIKT